MFRLSTGKMPVIDDLYNWVQASEKAYTFCHIVKGIRVSRFFVCVFLLPSE